MNTEELELYKEMQRVEAAVLKTKTEDEGGREDYCGSCGQYMGGGTACCQESYANPPITEEQAKCLREGI